jgi:gamma-D-glutamyl-L-lysine dipeptidyl-peptidase
MEETNDRPTLTGRPVVPVFRSPDALSEQVTQALLAQPVTVLEERAGWRRVRTPDGYEGWAEAETLMDAPAGWAEPWAEATDLWINLRAAPDFRLAAALHAVVGTRLPLVGEVEGWIQLLAPDGRGLWTESHRAREVDGRTERPAAPGAVCRTARRFIGVPYLWGGSSPVGLDCSGFVQLVMRLHGVPLLRDAYQQAEQGEPVEAPHAADLVFFARGERSEQVSHVGMMLDGHRFIHAAGGDCVRINHLSDAEYAGQLRCARRFIPRQQPPCRSAGSVSLPE